MAYTDLENIQRLMDRFRRPVPQTEEHQIRLAEEFELILNQRFTEYFLQICDIIDLTQDLHHMTRGSAGSSLVCYLLGITDVDPIKWQIPVARFMNPMRDDLPDVDIDFQHHKQGEVMNRIFRKWPGKTARLSNYVMYKEKSARREAAKRLGAEGNLPRNFTYESVGVDPVEARRIESKLMGKKRAISKHCGGIVMFTRKLPKSLISEDNQILLDKHEVEDLEHLKVDILANRGLSQLLEIDPDRPLTEYPEQDEKTAALLSRGDVLGVTQGESPAMRRLFRAIQPRSVQDCVFATALVRPVAMSGRQKAAVFQDWSQEAVQDSVVFEDDAIEIIADIIDVDYYEADMYRRAFAKKNDEVIMAHNTNEFWQACLTHCQGSYRRWVYQTEAHRQGITTQSGWWQRGFPNTYIKQQWLDRVEFAGVIANGRCYRGRGGKWVTFLTLGIDYGVYIDVTIQRGIAYKDGDIVCGTGRIRHSNNSDFVQSSDAQLYTFDKWRRK